MAREDLLELNAHKKTDALSRRRVMRRILATEHISDISQLRDRLAEEGHDQAEITVRYDLRDVGAVKLKRIDVPGEYHWVIPAYNPALEQLRSELNEEQLEAEVQLKMSAHAVDVHVINNTVHVLTEPRAGMLVAYWISWVTWNEIVHVQEHLDSCIVHCTDADAAEVIARRLSGA